MCILKFSFKFKKRKKVKYPDIGNDERQIIDKYRRTDYNNKKEDCCVKTVDRYGDVEVFVLPEKVYRRVERRWRLPIKLLTGENLWTD